MQGTTVEIRGCSSSWRWCSPRDRVRDGERTVCPGAGRAAFSKAHPSCPPKNSPLDTKPTPPTFVFLPTSQGLCTCFSSPGTPGLSQPQVALYITLRGALFSFHRHTHAVHNYFTHVIFSLFFSPKYETIRNPACTIHLWGARP